MATRHGTKKQALRSQAIALAMDDSINARLLRAGESLGEELMDYVLKSDPEIKALFAQLAKERVRHALRKLKVKPVV